MMDEIVHRLQSHLLVYLPAKSVSILVLASLRFKYCTEIIFPNSKNGRWVGKGSSIITHFHNAYMINV